MTPVPTPTTNTKTVFQKAPFGAMKTRTFSVLATLLLIEGVMIGQVLSRPAAAQTGAAQDCNKISDLNARAACWEKKARAGEKNLSGAFLPGKDLSKAFLNKANLNKAMLLGANLTGADLRGADLRKAFLLQTNLTGIIKDKDTKGL